MNWYACGTTWQWPLFESQHQRKEIPWDFIWSSRNILYFHFKMQILCIFKPKLNFWRSQKDFPSWGGIQGEWYGFDTSIQKKSQMRYRTWYKSKFISPVQVRYWGHNQQIFCYKRSCREKASCIKENPWTAVCDSYYPLSFHVYSHLNNFEEQRWTEK